MILPTTPFDNMIQAIDYAKNCFKQANLYYGHGTDNDHDEAVALVLHILGLSYTAIHTPDQLTKSLSSIEKQQLLYYIEQRIQKRRPVPYLTSTAWFAGMPFYVNPDVLIPRSPLAEWIERQFDPWVTTEQVQHILDLCTGSGCIATACAKHFPNAQIDASDICNKALNIAQKNISSHQVSSQVTLYLSNLFSALPNKQYDMIISNPPYVNLTEYLNLPQEYEHEPRLALNGGADGLVWVIKILQQALHYLSPTGLLIMEVGNREAELIHRFKFVDFIWLHCKRGGNGVLLLTAEQLNQYHTHFYS